MTYNPNDMIAYMPAIEPPFWLTAITLASTAVALAATAAFFYFFKGPSITFWLARSPRGQALLARNHYALGPQITPATLNHIIPEGPFKGQSVAFWLMLFHRGQALLAHNNYALLSQITPATLNHIIPDGYGPCAGQSVATRLVSSHKGRLLLLHNNYALGSQIKAVRLNDILSDDVSSYLRDPKLLQHLLQHMPTLRNEITARVPENVARLRSISRAATTCSALRSKHLNQRADYNPLDDLDSWEQHTIIGLCSLFRKNSDSNLLPCSTAVPTPN